MGCLIREALAMILDPETPEDEDLENQHFLDIYQEAMDLYGLIHARFIRSPKGKAVMREKFVVGAFGVCPRVLCGGQFVLPVGMSEKLRYSRVKVFCPRCQDVYIPKKKCSDVDGAYFGCSFPHILLQSNPDDGPTEEMVEFVPRIFGFRVYKKKGSKYFEEGKEKSYLTYYGENSSKKN